MCVAAHDVHGHRLRHHVALASEQGGLFLEAAVRVLDLQLIGTVVQHFFNVRETRSSRQV